MDQINVTNKFITTEKRCLGPTVLYKDCTLKKDCKVIVGTTEVPNNSIWYNFTKRSYPVTKYNSKGIIK